MDPLLTPDATPLLPGPSANHALVVEHHVALFWDWVAQPLLFGIVGTAVDFHKINASTIPKSIAVIFSGWLARMPVRGSRGVPNPKSLNARLPRRRKP
jgi:hypothetical protein